MMFLSHWKNYLLRYFVSKNFDVVQYYRLTYGIWWISPLLCLFFPKESKFSRQDWCYLESRIIMSRWVLRYLDMIWEIISLDVSHENRDTSSYVSIMYLNFPLDFLQEITFIQDRSFLVVDENVKSKWREITNNESCMIMNIKSKRSRAEIIFFKENRVGNTILDFSNVSHTKFTSQVNSRDPSHGFKKDSFFNLYIRFSSSDHLTYHKHLTTASMRMNTAMRQWICAKTQEWVPRTGRRSRWTIHKKCYGRDRLEPLRHPRHHHPSSRLPDETPNPLVRSLNHAKTTGKDKHMLENVSFSVPERTPRTRKEWIPSN